jgi:Na+/H+ antiporter NhaD/arsenite permease-like protein
MSVYMSLPFIGLILSIALLPLAAPKFWHQHYGKVAAGWLVLGVWSIVHFLSIETAVRSVSHTVLDEYIPFVCLVLALYTLSGGLRVHIHGNPTPMLNTMILLFGALFSNLVGTSGASVILIRPFLKLNHNRSHRVHQVIFFIFAVSNVGGMLTPLGDPPLFMGFLKGVDFFWTGINLWLPYIVTLGLLLTVFYVIDRKLCEPALRSQLPGHRVHATIDGKMHILLLLGVVVLVLQSGIWDPEVFYNIMGVEVAAQNILRDVGMVLIAGLSVLMTPMRIRHGHEFHWEPFFEVAKLFLAIFITLIPVMWLVKDYGASSVSTLTPDIYFWLTGLFSAFLDNAPTYLVFFNLAGGNAAELMTTHAHILAAITMGSVYLGAMTYIGNAPNFMVASIARNYQIRMPSFFGYMGWSIGVLLPIFALISWMFI